MPIHALISHMPGEPESLVYETIDLAEPGEHQARVRVHAAGVNFPDTLVIRDLYQFKPPRPFAPGAEFAGIIEATGSAVSGLKEGTRVLGMLTSGAFQTAINVDANSIVPIPDEMSYIDAAGFLFTYGTSHYALKDRGSLKSGETVLVLGAAGGVGSAAIELAKAMGARTIAAVSSAEKAAFCERLGADATLVYPRGPLSRDDQKALSGEIKALAGDGVDVVYDAVGGDYAEPALRAMAWEGRYLVVGFPAGIPAIPLNLTLLKSVQIVGVFWGAAIMRDPAGHRRNVGALFDLYQSGKIRPRITETFPLQDGAKALRKLMNRETAGKLVLTMD